MLATYLRRHKHLKKRQHCWRFLFVVHIEYDGECIRLISARKAVSEERKDYDAG